MAFNFDERIDRRHSDSLKWQKYGDKDIIPLWVADTDFRSPPCISDALQRRIAHGVFGYGGEPHGLTEVILARLWTRYQWKVEAEWLVYLPGVVSGLNLALRCATEAQQSSITPFPIYPPFRHAATLAGRPQRQAQMQLRAGRWLPDFSALEAGMDGSEKLLMLCNPHNPGGTVYRREELAAQLAFAQRHDLLVCSDEIHCDLLLEPGVRHLPFASLSEDAAQRSITLMSPSKSFNIAGLGASVAIIPNADLRRRFQAARKGLVPGVDILALVAAEAAWRDGQPWLDAQLDYLRRNRDAVVASINATPGLQVASPEGTYLAWIDASGLGLSRPEQHVEQHGVGLSAGRDFGDPHFVRLNFGCHRDLLQEALRRIQLAAAAV
ncbi:MalY/PatB family protein [Pantoea sp. 1.19]|uniref:MalY/PatB family protein n=1 Tax=Pantoea sp. 1.19 TaxID=1925589 RepID=UPI000948940C|nr:PatB family C-S lyase [Pantoea sp. 1.19]